MSGPAGSRQAFSLLELLAVCAIITLLAAMALPLLGQARMVAHRVKCASNQRQIGLALVLYAGEHEGYFPPTTHTTASMGKAGREESWIYQLAPYLEHIDEVRICPADEPERQRRIRAEEGLTSYVLNDIIFDPEEEIGYNCLQNLPFPARTMILFNVSGDRPINRGWDHAHCGGWTSWFAALADIEPDRHRAGARAKDRMKGSANYLYADGHVENISAALFKDFWANGNPAAVPLNP